MLNFKNIFINLVTIFAFFTLMALGTWQIDRLGQKNDLLKKIQSKANLIIFLIFTNLI